MSVQDSYGSVTAAYGRLTPSQYAIVALVWNGRDVRFNDKRVDPDAALTLMNRRVLDCPAPTNRFALLPPANVVRSNQGV